MSWIRRHIQLCLALAFAVGSVRIVFYYLVFEPLTVHAPLEVGASYQGLLPFLSNVTVARYLSDEPLDEDPLVPRQFDKGDLMYARAQYALAPTLLSRSSEHGSLTVVNFADPAALERVISSPKYAVVARAGATIALLREK